MTARLVAALEQALNQHIKTMNPDASVMVQFAAGDYVKLKEALTEYKDQLSAKQIHDIADAAEVVSHTSGGQPLPVETRLDMAMEQIDLAAAVQTQESAQTAADEQAADAYGEQMIADEAAASGTPVQNPGDPPPDELPPVEGAST